MFPFLAIFRLNLNAAVLSGEDRPRTSPGWGLDESLGHPEYNLSISTMREH